MKILFITPSFPTRMHRIRAWQLLPMLAKRHQVHLLTLSFGPPPVEELSELQRLCASVTVVRKGRFRAILDAFLGLFGREPLEVAYCASSQLAEKALTLCNTEGIELVYVKRLRSAQFVHNLKVRKILDSTDAMSLFYERVSHNAWGVQKIIASFEWPRYRAYERALGATFKEWVVCSSVDADFLRSRLQSDVRVSVIPNGVDLEYFTFSGRIPDSRTLLVSGLMNKFVNYEAAEYFVHRILPLVLREEPTVKLRIVGPSNARVERLGGPKVEVIGKVPDVRPYLREAAVVCVPIKTGAGTRNKILQAWAIGCPVVSTKEGAEGLRYSPGKDILIGETPETFAAQVVSLVRDSHKRDMLLAEGRRSVENTYDMRIIAGNLENLLHASP